MSSHHPLRLAVAATVTALLLPLGPASTATTPGATSAASAAPAAATSSPALRVALKKKAKKHAKPGRYKGRLRTSKGKRLEPFTFRVPKNGKRLKKFRVAMEVICSYYPPTVEAHALVFPKTKIKKNGKFKRIWKPNKKTRIVLKGRLKGKKLVNGKLNYKVGVCQRTAVLKAKRVGK